MLAVIHRRRCRHRPHHLGVDLLAAAVVEGQRDRHDVAFLHRRLQVDQHHVQAARLQYGFAAGLDVDGRHRAHFHDAAVVEVGVQFGDFGHRVAGLEHLDVLAAAVADDHEGAGGRGVGRGQADVGFVHGDLVGGAGQGAGGQQQAGEEQGQLVHRVSLFHGCSKTLRISATTCSAAAPCGSLPSSRPSRPMTKVSELWSTT